MTAGQIPPISSDESASSPRPSAGSSQERRTTLAKKSNAQMIAMTMRMFFDGILALSSV
jgi:hypothetical protein